MKEKTSGLLLTLGLPEPNILRVVFFFVFSLSCVRWRIHRCKGVAP